MKKHYNQPKPSKGDKGKGGGEKKQGKEGTLKGKSHEGASKWCKEDKRVSV